MERARSVSNTALVSPLGTLRVAAALFLVTLAVAASTASAITLPKGWSHAQVNVMIKHKAHTLIYDRGTVTRVAAGSLTLKEHDGTVVLIQVARSAKVTFDGARSTLATLRPGVFATTVRVDGAPAKEVHAQRVAPVS
ncbi:MAG TPA: hypothetical protein VG652_00365 [Gaiellaceae bacterium]|nr:hypothetical protein [Gaiellaceae bacterium]